MFEMITTKQEQKLHEEWLKNAYGKNVDEP